MRSIAIIVTFACILAYIDQAQGECCRKSLTVSYSVDGGKCNDVPGGRNVNQGCTITICAHGKARRGTYCGYGSCNIIGCGCKDGCIEGQWLQSFYNINRDHSIQVANMKWNL
ncbi:protein Diedel-like [Drosophila sulfurigaster albostrigata]|uniref:protein Diedel-like n=1 Tax=Drosophila sulfurigaster albostrigata TaxID=89887 RepID=UPI002D21E9D4|nr:protein Diedel-like [Drosophila sulfurigaster albostrigata]